MFQGFARLPQFPHFLSERRGLRFSAVFVWVLPFQLIFGYSAFPANDCSKWPEIFALFAPFCIGCIRRIRGSLRLCCRRAALAT